MILSQAGTESFLRGVSPRRRFGLGLLTGAIAALGQAPFDLWPVALIGFAAQFLLFCTSTSLRQAALGGWAAGVGYFALALSWIVEPFLVDLARHGWMAPFALVFLSGGLALFWGLAAALAFWMQRGALAWVLALCLAELTRSYIFTGFPWALIGHIWIGSPVLQWAAFAGPHGLTMFALLAAVSPLWMRRSLPAFGLGILVWGLMLWGGLALRGTPADLSGAPIVRLVQPNAPQHQKWDPDHVSTFFRRQITATTALPRPDLIVWPETAVPVSLDYAQETLQVMADAAQGVPLVFGIQRFEGPRVFNSAAVLRADGTLGEVYDKHHLVPFGEYVPFGDQLGRFGISGLAATEGAGFSAGPGPRLLDVGPLGKVLPLICYEAVFPNDVAGAPARPSFLLQMTNDAWFGRVSGPYQHLAQARLRAVEQGLPLLRSANTGVSAVIDAKGRVLGQLALNTQGHLDAALPPAMSAPLYARSGDIFAAFAIIFLLAAVFALNVRRQRPIGD